MAVIVEDSFEGGGYVVGDAPPSPWVVTLADGGGAVTIDNDPDASSPRGKTLKIYEGLGAGATTTHDEAKLPLGTTKDALTLVFEVRPLTTSRTLYFGVYAGGTRYDILKLSSTAHVQYLNSSSVWTNFATDFVYSSVTWIKIRVVIDRNVSNKIVAVTINETGKGTSLTLPAIPSAISDVVFSTENTEDDGTWWVHNVQVIDSTATITGVVRDNTATPVVGARVYLMRHNTPQYYAPPGYTLISTTLTDNNGVYSFSSNSGVYLMVFAQKESGSPTGGAAWAWIWAR